MLTMYAAIPGLPGEVVLIMERGQRGAADWVLLVDLNIHQRGEQLPENVQESSKTILMWT